MDLLGGILVEAPPVFYIRKEREIAKSYYLLAIKRQDGRVVLSQYDLRLHNRTLSQLLELAKAIKAKPLYAVRVKPRVLA